MSTENLCSRCCCALAPDQPVAFVRAMATDRVPDGIEIDSLSPEEFERALAALYAELEAASAREAEEDNSVSQIFQLCSECFDSWSWERLRSAPDNQCTCCDSAIVIATDEFYRAGFVVVTLQYDARGALGPAGLARLDKARISLSRRLQSLPDPESEIGQDDFVAFSLCHSCKGPWIEEPLNDSDWA